MNRACFRQKAVYPTIVAHIKTLSNCSIQFRIWPEVADRKPFFRIVNRDSPKRYFETAIVTMPMTIRIPALIRRADSRS